MLQNKTICAVAAIKSRV